ncbi:hypothetical protein B484DRAFT_23196 [Ochromonadaceae sp. CCMP2298]|nr:hypothetical protein B484DRAFT_23196 [Ochromonadaceae sp. CCMP2298]
MGVLEGRRGKGRGVLGRAHVCRGRAEACVSDCFGAALGVTGACGVEPLGGGRGVILVTDSSAIGAGCGVGTGARAGAVSDLPPLPPLPSLPTLPTSPTIPAALKSPQSQVLLPHLRQPGLQLCSGGLDPSEGEVVVEVVAG